MPNYPSTDIILTPEVEEILWERNRNLRDISRAILMGPGLYFEVMPVVETIRAECTAVREWITAQPLS